MARCIKDAPAERQKEAWDSWAKQYLHKASLGAWGALTSEEYSDFLRWPLAFTSLAEIVLDAVRKLPVQKITRLDVLHEIRVSGIVGTQPDFAVKYLRWLFENVTPGYDGIYGMDDVIDTVVVTPTNSADLKALAERLLLIDASVGDRLLAKLKKP